MRLNPTNFIIGMLLLGFVLFVVMGFIQRISAGSEIEDYNGNAIKMNFSEDLEGTIQDAGNDLIETSKGDSSILDIIGAFVNAAWTPVKSLVQTTTTFNEFSDQAVASATTSDGETAIFGLSNLRSTGATILLVLLFIGFAAYFLTGRDT